MTDLKIIFDGSLSPNFISESESFSNAKYLFFVPLGLSDSEYIEFGAMLEVSTPTSNDGVQAKLFPFSSGLVDTDYLYLVPSEISSNNYACKLYLNSTFSFALRVYAITNPIEVFVPSVKNYVVINIDNYVADTEREFFVEFSFELLSVYAENFTGDSNSSLSIYQLAVSGEDISTAKRIDVFGSFTSLNPNLSVKPLIDSSILIPRPAGYYKMVSSGACSRFMLVCNPVFIYDSLY